MAVNPDLKSPQADAASVLSSLESLGEAITVIRSALTKNQPLEVLTEVHAAEIVANSLLDQKPAFVNWEPEMKRELERRLRALRADLLATANLVREGQRFCTQWGQVLAIAASGYTPEGGSSSGRSISTAEWEA